MAAVLPIDKLTAERWARIESFTLDQPGVPLPFSKCLAHEMGWDAAFVELAILEYKRFTLLCTLYPEQTVPSTHVDTVWHMHLLYTRNYQKYCREALGQDFLHHQPAGGDEEEAAEFKELYLTTLERYRRLFGEPAPKEIWGE